MTFLAPAMLAGAAAVAVPVGLHFLFKPRPRPLPWAAMTFLKLSVDRTSRRLKFRELVLLLLRCLGLLLLAAALARPSCSALPQAPAGGADAVLVVDTSYSMGAKDGGASRFDRAKDAALAVVDGLPPGSTVRVIGSAARAAELGPPNPVDRDAARRLIRDLTPSGTAGGVVPGLVEAAAAVDRGVGPQPVVYLVSDLQRSGWADLGGAAKAAADRLRQKGAGPVVVRCGDPAAVVPNVAVADLSFPGDLPHTDPARPTRLPVTVLVRNTGPVAVRDLTVALAVDGDPAAVETAAVPEVARGQTVPVALTARLPNPGPVLLTCTVSGDRLPGDDRLDRLVNVRDRVRVLVVDGRVDRDDPTRNAGHYLANALAPVPPAERADYFVRVTAVPPSDAPAELAAADVVALCDVAADDLPAGFAARLAGWVRAGGGLLVGAGDHVRPDRYNDVLGVSGAKVLPVGLVAADAAPPDRPFRPAADAADPAGFLARFRLDPFRTAAAEVDIRKLVTVVPEAAGGRAVLPLADGRPLVTAARVGDGQAVFVGTTLDDRWTDWPARAGAYVGLVRFALAHLTGGADGGANVTAGQQLVYHPSAAPREFEAVRPDGRRTPLGPATADADGRLTVRLPSADPPGVYRLAPAGDDGPKAGQRFAVAADLAESADLAVLSDADVEAAFGFPPAWRAGGAGPPDGRTEWAEWLFVGLFVLLVAEAGWAAVCDRPQAGVGVRG